MMMDDPFKVFCTWNSTRCGNNNKKTVSSGLAEEKKVFRNTKKSHLDDDQEW